MEVRVPKHVCFENKRLRRFSQCTHIIYVILLVLFTIRARFFSQSFSMGHTIQVNFEVDGSQDRAKLQQEYQRMHQMGQVCADASKFDDTRQVNGVLYHNHSCIQACGEQPNAPCLDVGEMYKKVSKEDVVFFTQMTEASYSSSSNRTMTSCYLIPYVGAFGLKISLLYEITSAEMGRLMALSDRYLRGGSLDELETILLSSDGKPRRVVPPGSSIDVSMGELLEMSGNRMVLSQPTTGGDYPWVTGLDLEILVDCRPIGDTVFPGKGVCTLEAKSKPRRVAFQTSVSTSIDRSTGRSVQGLFHGVHVSFRKAGKMDVLDPERIYYNVISILVLLFIPRWLVLQVVTNGLGRLSSVFRDQIFERYSMTNHVAKMATQLMSNQLAYDGLCDQHNGISKARVNSRVRQALTHQLGVLDPDEVDSFINYTFSSINMSDFGTWSSEKTAIQMESFMKCVDADRFINLILLFDIDRTPWPWESFFTSNELKQAIGLKPPDAPVPGANSKAPAQSSSSEDSDKGNIMLDMGFQPSSTSQERHKLRTFDESKLQTPKYDEDIEKQKDMKLDGANLPNLDEVHKLIESRLKATRTEIDLHIMHEMQKVLSACVELEKTVGRHVEKTNSNKSEVVSAAVSKCPSFSPEPEENNSAAGSIQQGDQDITMFTEGTQGTITSTEVELLPKPSLIQRLLEDNAALMLAKVEAAETARESLSAEVAVLQQRVQSLEQHQSSTSSDNQQQKSLSVQVRELSKGLKQMEFRLDAIGCNSKNVAAEIRDPADSSSTAMHLAPQDPTPRTSCAVTQWGIF